jgi:putative hemolysin
MDTSDKFLDIDEAIRRKNPGLLKVIPKFLLNYLKRIIHQDDMNAIIVNAKGASGLSFVKSALNDLGTTYKALQTENIPATGRYIFASNHPLGGLDGMVLMDAVGKVRPQLKFIVNDLLLNIKNLETVFVPVNKHGRQNTEYLRKIEDLYASDEQVLNFPAGLCSRKIKGKITDLPWQKNFILKSIKYKRDIIPVYFDARNSNFFYNLANIRKFFGIKANIEMLYLPDEMFKQRNKPIRLIFGKPIPYTTFDKSKPPAEWANLVRNEVYSLANKL